MVSVVSAELYIFCKENRCCQCKKRNAFGGHNPLRVNLNFLGVSGLSTEPYGETLLWLTLYSSPNYLASWK